MRHIISILLENESGALSRVAGLFSARGYNIESLTVAPTEDPTLSRMTLVTSGSEEIIEHCGRELAGFKKPKRVVFRDELPKNPSGKILKRELKRDLQETAGP